MSAKSYQLGLIIAVQVTCLARGFYRFFARLVDFEGLALTFARIFDRMASCFALVLAASFAMLLFNAATSFRSVAA